MQNKFVSVLEEVCLDVVSVSVPSQRIALAALCVIVCVVRDNQNRRQI